MARVEGNQDVRSVFQDVLSGLRPAHEKEVLDAHRLAAEAVFAGDSAAYAEVGGRWLVGRSIGRSVDWLVGWLVDWCFS